MRCARTPYVIAPTRAASDPRIKRIVVAMFAQGGKTNILFNIAGHRLDDRPAPILYIGPTKTNITNVIEPKIDQLLRTCASLWDKTVQGKRYTRVKKIIAGVSFRFAWAGSPTELASDSACIVLVDEPDRMDRDIGGEGSIWNLADARHGTYLEGKTVGVSTPTEGNIETFVHPKTGLTHWAVADLESVVSSIWRAWQAGTRFEWAWPCPTCREYFIPRLVNLWWPKDSTQVTAMFDARVVCPSCDDHIDSSHKEWMNERGCYVAPGQKPLKYKDGDRGTHLADFTGKKPPTLRRRGRGVTFCEWGDYVIPEDAENSTASFWASGLANYQPKKTFGALAAEHIAASRSGDDVDVKGCLNLQFGECFKFSGDAPEWQQVLMCAADYVFGEVPEHVIRLVAGVDVGKRRLHYVIRGFGADGTSWLVDRDEIAGDTQREKVWEELQTVLDGDYNGHHVSTGMVDSGYRRDEVYTFCRRIENRKRFFPSKGGLATQKPFWSTLQDVTANGKVTKRGITLWNFDSDIFKSWVHGRITWQAGSPGAWYLPRDIDEEYCRQIINEQRLITPAGRIMWKVMGQNHYLDCEALAALAMRRLGKKAKAQPRRPKKTVVVSVDEAITNTRPQRTQQASWMKRGGGWMNR